MYFNTKMYYNVINFKFDNRSKLTLILSFTQHKVDSAERKVALSERK